MNEFRDSEANPLEIYPLDVPRNIEFVTLADGASFPLHAVFRAHYKVREGTLTTPVFDITVEVENEQPVVTGVGTFRMSGPPITGSVLDDLPFESILEQVIEYAKTFALYQMLMRDEDGRPVPTQAEFKAARADALTAQRGRPVPLDTFRRVALIVGSNTFNPRIEIERTLGVSGRTASRYIAEAKRRGMLDNDNQED